MKFLIEIFGIDREDLRFGLQIFTDIDPDEAIEYWVKELDIQRHQLYKPVITLSNSLGTYRKKSKYGVMTLHCHNSKLRNLLLNLLSNPT